MQFVGFLSEYLSTRSGYIMTIYTISTRIRVRTTSPSHIAHLSRKQ